MITAMHAHSGAFNSRPHKEVDRSASQIEIVNCFFQFTTSQGGRLEADDQETIRTILSIHDLTRRSTCSRGMAWRRIYLSIHDLTRRSTQRA